jgi:hypothetical protein
MKTVKVTLKGVEWGVREDGAIFSDNKVILCTRVRNGTKQTYQHKRKSQQISPCKTKSGYLEVSTKSNGKRVKALVHRLVGIAFVKGHKEGLTINHINGIKIDNRPENLEWVSLSKNTKHQWEIGLVDIRGEKHPNSKLTSKQVIYIRRLLDKGIPAYQLAVISGVSSSLINLIRRNKRWKNSGLVSFVDPSDKPKTENHVQHGHIVHAPHGCQHSLPVAVLLKGN